MYKKTVIASALGLMAAAGMAQADTPSFNYVQFEYVFAGELEDDQNTYGDDLDIESGYAIEGSFEIGEYIFVGAETLDVDYDTSDVYGIDLFSETDSTLLGIGVHMPLAEIAEVYGQIGLSRVSNEGVVGDGFGYKLGARANVGEMVELGLSYTATMNEAETSLVGDIDLDSSLLGLDAFISFAPGAPQLVLSYNTGTAELDVTGFDAEFDVSYFSLGVRKTFN